MSYFHSSLKLQQLNHQLLKDHRFNLFFRYTETKRMTTQPSHLEIEMMRRITIFFLISCPDQIGLRLIDSFCSHCTAD